MTYRRLTLCGMVIVLRLAAAHADAPQIDIPGEPPDVEPAQNAPPPSSEPISTTVRDEKDKDWRQYDNRIVKIHVRVNATWTTMEYKETEQSGAVSFTLSHAPLVTFSVSRYAMDGAFEEWVSSASLASLYPEGCKKSTTEFAGRRAILTRGVVKDGRLDESYFSTDGKSIYQVSFTAPADALKDYTEAFRDLKSSFRWLPK